MMVILRKQGGGGFQAHKLEISDGEEILVLNIEPINLKFT